VDYLDNRESAYQAWLEAHKKATAVNSGNYQKLIELRYQADLLRIEFLKIVEKQIPTRW
jgi:hypothetical protein